MPHAYSVLVVVVVVGLQLCGALVPPHGNANLWRCRPAPQDLCLLPFPMADGLLPGESLTIHLTESHQMDAFHTSMQRQHGCFGQFLERRHSSSSDVNSFCAVAPLLELREHRSHHGGVWCEFVCVGAVRLDSVELRTAAEQSALDCIQTELVEEGELVAASDAGGQPFLVGQACFVDEEHESVDEESADDEEAFLVLEVSRVHKDVNRLRRKALELNADGPLSASDRITSGGERIGPPPSASDRVTGGYRLGPLIGPHIDLDELLRLRVEALSVRGVDEAPQAAGTPSRLLELWGSADEESVRRRLLSFVAVESLHESYRMSALAMGDTVARLEHAREGLERRKAMLAAEVALRAAGSDA
jgi:hypothetical protein